MKKCLFLIAAGMFFSFVSCKEKIDPSVCTALNFESSIINVNVDESKELNVNIEPEECIDYANINYSILNDTVASIEYTDNKVCKIKGIRKGATVISASCQDITSKAVINVYDSKSEARLAADDKWYLYTITYNIEGGMVSQCFYKTKPYDYAVYDGFLRIEKENGIYLQINLNDLYDINFTEETEK